MPPLFETGRKTLRSLQGTLRFRHQDAYLKTRSEAP